MAVLTDIDLCFASQPVGLQGEEGRSGVFLYIYLKIKKNSKIYIGLGIFQK